MRTMRCAPWAAALAVLALVGCGDDGPTTAEVTGTVSVNGQTPAAGSSITFIPADGKSQTTGALIEDGKYAVRVPVGTAKVEIRVPRPVAKPGRKTEGPGPGGDIIEESLPPRYNDETELTFEVKKGKNEKNWDLTVP
ncbi:MAG TPA: hypothetical protein VKD90_20360 [Gemmataceae bacterium]|nr:hypothetical protein [Gemmataceae bacterium]